MLERFIRFIEDERLLRKAHPVLLAVSGGVDSAVMCHLFSKAGISFAIAHCNFRLRENESDDDEQFVKQLAESYSAPFYVKHFDTQQFADTEGISVQMAARRLRYEWFEQVRDENMYSAIATAHHKNDDVETFFINLVRGTGIAGLKGIRPRHNNIIRPLLFALREEIEAYAKENGLHWREDSSNLSSKYLRNKIRQSIIPAFKEISSNFEQTISNDIRRISEAFAIVEKHIEEKRQQLVKEDKDDVLISISGLLHLDPLHIYLYELLKPYNFREPVVTEIANALNALPGKQFRSSTHRLIKDRDVLIISPAARPAFEEVIINEEDQYLDDPLRMHFSTIQRNDLASLRTLPSIAYLDKDKLRFPLVLRKWQAGDSFHPLGMQARKKLSDFFIDNKFSIADKERAWVLTSGGEIAWIAGHRVDDRFKVTDATREVYVCKLID